MIKVQWGIRNVSGLDGVMAIIGAHSAYAFRARMRALIYGRPYNITKLVGCSGTQYLIMYCYSAEITTY